MARPINSPAHAAAADHRQMPDSALARRPICYTITSTVAGENGVRWGGWTSICGAIALASCPVTAAERAAKSVWEQEALSGDWGGLRPALKDKGLEFTVVSIDELFGPAAGGLDRRASYEGRTEFTIDANLQTLIGWAGASAHTTIFQIRNGGHNVADNVGSLSDPSNIDALPTTRLYTAWLEQTWLDKRVSLRVGGLGADEEFFTTASGNGLINATFGWGDLNAADLRSGGPAYPLAAPGARLALKPTDAVTVQAAVFSGDPAGPGCTDLPQRCNRYGLTFAPSNGAFLIGEVQYAENPSASGPDGTFKLGAWYATGHPNEVPGVPLRQGDASLYAVADRTVWRGRDSSVALFLRGAVAPRDGNLIPAYVDGGLAWKGPLPGRKDDTFTVGIAYADIGADVAAADRAAGNVVRDYELVLEASYMVQVAQWWTVQPDVQFIVHPNGGQDPQRPAERLGNALILGVRSTVKF
jgi:porin